MIPRNYVNILLSVVSFVFLQNCAQDKNLNTGMDEPATYWHKDLDVDLGAKTETLENGSTLIISRGRGENIRGFVYQKIIEEWITVDSFDYSDYPQLSSIGNTFYYIYHQTHHGFYRPRMFKVKEGINSEISLPAIMWDDTDYVMWRGMSVLSENNIWLVGQHGNIIHFDGNSWKKIKNPAENLERIDLSKGDLTSIKMINNNTGVSVGKDGMILKYNGNYWRKLNAYTDKFFNSVDLNENGKGWIVGEKGTIIRIEGDSLTDRSLNEAVDLNSVKIIDENNAVAVGNNSSLYIYKNGLWKRDSSALSITDDYVDVEVISSETGKNFFLLVGLEGVYSNSEVLGFSFTKITTQANIKNFGNAGVFFQQFGEFPSLMVENENSAVVLYDNNGNNIFIEKLLPLTGNVNTNLSAKSIVADFNNDGFKDIILIYSATLFYFFLGQDDGSFIDATSSSGLSFESIDQILKMTISTADFNADGFLDIYITNHNSRDYLFEGNGADRFIDRYSTSGIEKELGYESFGATIADYNNDNLPDVFLTYKQRIGSRNSDLFINEGDFKFRRKIDSAFVTGESPLTYSSLSADFDNNGANDILVFSNRVPPAIYLNDGNADFRNASSEFSLDEIIYHPDPTTGLLGAADVNNDGFIDIFMSNKLYLNRSGKKFEAAGGTGINFTGNPSFADIDLDGDFDLFVGSSTTSLGSGERAAIFRNNLNNGNFAFIELLTDRSNRDAIGSKIFIKSFDIDGKLINNLLYEVGTGSSPIAQNNLNVHLIGIPQADSISAEIIFPNGTVKEIEKIKRKQKYTVYESGLILNKIILAFNSIDRSIKTINVFYEIVRLVVLALLFVLSLFSLRKFDKNDFRTGISALLIFLIFLMLVHFFHNYRSTISILIPIIAPVFVFILFAYAVSQIKETRARKFISHFKIESIIGEGGMGKVYKAADIHTKQVIALKVLHPQLMNDPENKKRLTTEGQILSSFDHPHIIRVSEIGEAKDYSFIAMDYLPNGTLQNFIEEKFPLPQNQVKRILIQICEGLSAIHSQKVIHRDLKSANIMFDDEMNIKIMDFGLSKSPLVSQMTSLGTVIGTLGYVAPEQVTNIKVDERTDIFSLGVIMYQMLTNSLPFKGENEIALIHSIFNTIPENPSLINKSVSKIQDQVVLKAIAKDPNDRYTNCKILQLDIEKYF